jgi:hypothetical protein
MDGLKDNPDFPSPVPTLDVIEKATNDYSAALSNAGGRDRTLVSIKNDKKAVLHGLLKDLAHYVTQVSKGDRTLLLSSGFEITPERNKAAKLPPRLEVDISLPGQATTRVKRITRARAYMHQYAPDPLTPETVWTSETTLFPQHTFTGLAATSRLWFRVIAITSKGEQLHWEPVSRVIQ